MRGRTLSLSRLHLCIAAASAFVLLAPVMGASAAEEYVLDISRDNYKVVFISGNLTAAATYAWPRVVFYHSTSILSPFFEVGFPRLYLFNDSNGDGRFQRYEEIYVGFLDAYYTKWTLVEPVKDSDSTVGQFAEFGMKSTVSLHLNPLNLSASVNDWANITFWFRIGENGQTFVNSQGSYVVRGKTEMRINLTIDVSNHTEAHGMVLEQSLQGGGSVEMFLLRQQVSDTEENMTMVSGRIDESPNGLNLTHCFNETIRPRQEAWFSKVDWTSLAYYFWNSETTLESEGGSSRWSDVNSSYYTTGTGLMLHSVYGLQNDTSILTTDMSIGLEESGFEIRVRDWLKRNMLSIVVTSAILIGLTASVGYYLKRNRRKALSAPLPEDTVSEEQPPKG